MVDDGRWQTATSTIGCGLTGLLSVRSGLQSQGSLGYQLAVECLRQVLSSSLRGCQSHQVPTTRNASESNVGSLIIGIGFWGDYTIVIIRSPQHPILIIKAPTLCSMASIDPEAQKRHQIPSPNQMCQPAPGFGDCSPPTWAVC